MPLSFYHWIDRVMRPERVWRRWIRLISADWLPAFHRFVAGLPRSRVGDQFGAALV